MTDTTDPMPSSAHPEQSWHYPAQTLGGYARTGQSPLAFLTLKRPGAWSASGSATTTSRSASRPRSTPAMVIAPVDHLLPWHRPSTSRRPVSKIRSGAFRVMK